MRIIGGKFKGHGLVGPKGQATRPTSDRVRESIFNILAHGIEGFSIEGARVLDLFAGTGAMGLEALSRGARFCQFVDDAAEAHSASSDNARSGGAMRRGSVPQRRSPASTSFSPIRPTTRIWARKR